VGTIDALEQLPDQDRAEYQSSDVPIQSGEAYLKVISDSEPLTVRYVR
jgi:hypothetical protein